MLERVYEYIKENNMLSYGDRVIVGVSGGADSICLLHMLCALRKRLGLTVEVVHINHCIRGKAADEDEKYVCEMAKLLECKMHTRSYQVEKMACELGKSVEEMGRELRYRAFEEIAGKDKIAVAHNMNDNCETMLMRFFRGTGLKGLGGILPERDNIIRPLLCLKRTEIERYCTENRLEYRLDSTNLVNDYTRNRIRLDIIPEIEKFFNGSITDTMYRTAEIMRSEEEYIAKQAKKAYESCLVKKNTVSVERLMSYPEVIRRRIIRLGFIDFSIDLHDISFDMVQAVLSLCNKPNGKTIELVHGLRARREYDNIRFYKEDSFEDYCYELIEDKPVTIKEIGLTAVITAKNSEWDKKNEKLIKFSYTNGLKYDILKNVLLIRNYRSGDKIYQRGINGHKSVKKLFAELKLDGREKKRVPMLICNNEAVCVCGYRTSDLFKADNENEAVLYLYEDK